jgi:hypothetical protein
MSARVAQTAKPWRKEPVTVTDVLSAVVVGTNVRDVHATEKRWTVETVPADPVAEVETPSPSLARMANGVR